MNGIAGLAALGCAAYAALTEDEWEGRLSFEFVERMVEHRTFCAPCRREWNLRRHLDDLPAAIWELAHAERIERSEASFTRASEPRRGEAAPPSAPASTESTTSPTSAVAGDQKCLCCMTHASAASECDDGA